MPRKFFTNSASTSIGSKQPGEVFQLPVDDDGSPVDLYWRKRLADATVAPYVPPVAADETSNSPVPASPGDASEVKPTVKPKKGA